MAHVFLGRRAVVTLKHPAGSLVEGTVAQVITEPGSPQLVLNDVLFRDSGHRFPTWQVSGTHIADLQLQEHLQQPTPRPDPLLFPQPKSSAVRNSNAPVDPAILSVGKPRPTSQIYIGTNSATAPQAVQSWSNPPSAKEVPGSTPPIPQPTPKKGDLKVDAAARLKGPFSALAVDPEQDATDEDAAESIPVLPKDPRRQPHNQPTKPKQPFTILRRDPKISQDVSETTIRGESRGQAQSHASIEVAEERQKGIANQQGRRSKRNQNKTQSKTQIDTDKRPVPSSYRGTGWRQSPMLKDAILADEAPTQSNKAKKRNAQKKRRSRGDDLTGWATEDATDIQELGDFDFEGGLAKFDKRSVFEQLRKEDSIPEEERLVGHNRLKSKPARPGTFGGTKLHPTENVLDGPKSGGLASKSTSRRGSTRVPVLSSDDSAANQEDDLRTSSRISSRIRQRKPLMRTSTTSLHKMERSSTEPTPARRIDSSVPLILRPSNTASSTSNGHLPRLTPSESDGLAFAPENSTTDGVHFYTDKKLICPVITPGGMSALEDLAVSEHNLSLQTINENAGRSLAEIILTEFADGKNEISDTPTAIFLVGNHRVGARALVAARHLRNRGLNAVCCVLGMDRPGHQRDAEVAKQLNMIGEAVVANWREVQKYLTVNEEQGQFADVWVDGLLAPGHSYDTLVPEDQNAVREMVSWANRRPTQIGPRLIFSIDVPCGINASTGETIVTENNSRIQMRSSFIACMGAPRIGLLTALRNAWRSWTSDSPASRMHSMQTEALLGVTVYAVDIGINEVWKAYGQELELATGSGVDFGMKWFMTLRLDQNAEERVDWETE